MLGGTDLKKGLRGHEEQLEDFADTGIILRAVMDGITDIIGVYKPDHTLVMYNKAGYDFFEKTYEEVIGKKCFEILGRKIPCSLCTTEQALEAGKQIRLEKYIPEMGKCMECSSKPVYDKNGKVTYIVEQLRDVTEQKKFEIEIRKSEEKFRNLVELSPDAIIVVCKNEIVMANHAALKLANLPTEKLIGMIFFEFIDPSYRIIARERIEMLLKNKKEYSFLEYKLNFPDGRLLSVEVVASYLDYNGTPAMQAVIRDVTEKKREIEWAASIQSKRLETRFPIETLGSLKAIYRPAQTLSGDFYHLLKMKENVVIGLIGDVSGKGVAASLSASAVKVLFHEATNKYSEPKKILEYMNIEVVKYLGDEYIAASCFKFDFDSKICTVVGAGIGEFSYVTDEGTYRQLINKGAFLGMFENGSFEQRNISFREGYRFYFYTDGLSNLFEREIVELVENNEDKELNIFESISELLFIKNITEDDCTLLEIRIN